jgi:acyl carrier protein
MKDHVYQTVARVVQQELDVVLSDIEPDTDLRAQANIDSMQYVALSVILEDALKIELPISIMRARTLNEILDIVRLEVVKSDHAS